MLPALVSLSNGDIVPMATDERLTPALIRVELAEIFPLRSVPNCPPGADIEPESQLQFDCHVASAFVEEWPDHSKMLFPPGAIS